MHAQAVDEIVKLCRKRLGEGDCPTDALPATEVLEDAVLELAYQRDLARRQLPALAGAMLKFAPDLAHTLCHRWQTAQEDETAAFKELMSLLTNTSSETST